jgi:hypothetical protein
MTPSAKGLCPCTIISAGPAHAPRSTSKAIEGLFSMKHECAGERSTNALDTSIDSNLFLRLKIYI